MQARIIQVLCLITILVPCAIWIVTKNFNTSFIIFILLMTCLSIYGLFLIKRDLNRQNQSEIWKTDKMRDEELEKFIAGLLSKLDYMVEIPLVKQETSFLITSPDGKTAAVKVKSSNRAVGIRLVKGAFKESHSLQAGECWVITNNRSFTAQAEEFAKQNHIRLYARDQLMTWIIKAERG